MAKRFADTNKYKKPFIRSLPGAYKILWDFLYLDCDHAGIWIVDFEIAQTYVGSDMPVNMAKAIELFNKDEIRIVQIDGGKKWFIVPFIGFQYGKLSEKNRAHAAVISALKKFDLLEETLILKDFSKPLTSPLQGAKDKDMDMDKEKEKEGGMGEMRLCPEMVKIFKSSYPEYPEESSVDHPSCLQIAHKIAKTKGWTKESIVNGKLAETLLAWRAIVVFSKSDNWFSTRSISDFNKEYQRLIQKMSSNGSSNTGNFNKKPIPTGDVAKGGFGKL